MPHLDIDGRSLHYLDVGEGFPLVFGHSYLWDAAMWAPQLERLSRRYRCIVPELWGHGASGGLPDAACSMQRLAADHWALTLALGLERFALLGLSVGGMWGAHLAAEHPEAVAALVLMDTYLGAEPEASRALYFAMMDAIERAGCIDGPLLDAIVPMFFSPVSFVRRPALVDGFRQSLASVRGERLRTVLSVGRGIFGREEGMQILSSLSMPSLVVVGEDDHPRPPHEARAMAEALPNGRLALVPAAGHICTLEQPELVTGILEEFLGAVLPG